MAAALISLKKLDTAERPSPMGSERQLNRSWAECIPGLNFLTTPSINHALSATRHYVDSVVKSPAMSFEFVIIASTPNNFEYPVALALENRSRLITAHPIGRRNI